MIYFLWFRPACLFINQPVRSISKVFLDICVYIFLLMSATFVTLCSVHNVNPGFSMVNVADLCCAIHVLSERIQCAVWCLPSAGLWCCSQGWQWFWLLTSFILWPHSHCSRSCVAHSFAGASIFLTSTFLCFSSVFPFLPAALQYLFARLRVLHY